MSRLLEDINKKFYRAYSARGDYYAVKKNWEELYYNDVEKTLSQFTKKQIEAIKATYNIEISTKVAYAIIEQALSLVTGSNPFPMLLAADETTEDFTETYTKAHHGSWYESRASYELIRALRDMFVVGHGLMRVRPNDFFNETTFNVIYEHLDWKRFIGDPESTKPDLSDSSFMFITRVIRRGRAEKEFGIDLSKYKLATEFASVNWYDIEEDFYGSLFYKEQDEDDEPVLVKEYFEKEEVSVYIGDSGDFSLKRPRATQLPNPEKEAAQMEYDLMAAEYETTAVNAETQDSGMAPVQDNEQFMEEADAFGQRQEQQQADAQTAPDLQQRMMQLESVISSMPDTVDGYILMTERGEPVPTYNYDRVKRKKVKRVLIVGDHEVERGYVPGDSYPVIFFPFSHFGNCNRCFGMMHYIMDLQKALNRLWSMMLNEMQTNGLSKVIYPNGAITDPNVVESKWSLPGAWIPYQPNPALPNGGEPKVVVPPPLNSTLQFLLQSIISTIEYVTGINSALQGQSDPNQTTMGGTHSLQNYGSQRLKLYARQLERPLEILALTGVSFLQHYAPRDKVLRFFNKENQPDQVQIMESAEDLQFKVRVDIGSSLATTRQMAHQLLATIAGQTQNPDVADMLTQHALELIDLPEGRQWSEEIDVIQKLKQQVGQLSQQLDEAQKQNKSLENNMQQKQMASRVDSAVKDTEMNLERMEMDKEKEDNAMLDFGDGE